MTKHVSKTADELILAQKSEHHTHTYEHKSVNLFAYFDKKISMWVIQDKHQSTVRFDDALDPPLHFRSLADITELVDLRKKNVNLKNDRKTLISLVLRLVDRWWPFVHNSVAPSNTAYNLGLEASNTLDKLNKNYSNS